MKKKLVILTGAGVSAESGIPTFRDAVDGLWENASVEQVCTVGCFDRNAEIAYKFYSDLHDKYKNCKHNQAHKDIADLEKGYDVTVITQNVDNLHEQAGSTKVIHLHGELNKIRAMDDPSLIWDWEDSIKMNEDTIIDGHHIRPHIVMFGEDVPNIEIAQKIMCDADICVVIGTSFNVYPAAGLIEYVPYGNPIYYIDPNPAYTPDFPDIKVIKATATAGMKELIQKLKENEENNAN